MGAGDKTRGKMASTLGNVHRGSIRTDPLTIRAHLNRSNPERSLALAVARVTEVDYEEMFVTLRTAVGAKDAERVPVPITFPGVGNRHFFGAMPEIGDYCIVGWMPQESSNPQGTKTPVILSWIVPGVWTGRDWMTTAPFEEGEYPMTSKRERDVTSGQLDRHRHKLLGLNPGNIAASSSQGADLILTESVLIANRRGNEIRLRDQDQALVVRSLQQFHAMAGARTYSGMVQRDALLLQPIMVSDGKEWDGDAQVRASGATITEGDLPTHTSMVDGVLYPATPLIKPPTFTGVGSSLLKAAEGIDPYEFLKGGGLIDEHGDVVPDLPSVDGYYGGKPIFRVARALDGSNAILSADADTLTEWRVEVAHTSDGRLPVTEQTDMFDADRVCPAGLDSPQRSKNAAYIEYVLGSVVGNDPWSATGRTQYGLPLVASVFAGGDIPQPRLDAIQKKSAKRQATPIEHHAATLFKITPLQGGAQTWWSINKSGQLKAAIAGSPTENSVEVALKGGMKLHMGGHLRLILEKGISFGGATGRVEDNVGAELSSAGGAINIFGGASIKGAEGAGESLMGTGKGQAPSVRIEGATGVEVRTNKQLALHGSSIRQVSTEAEVVVNETYTLSAAKKIALTTEEMTTSVAGRRSDSFAGPKMALPTSGPLHERSYVPTFPGVVCEKVSYEMGDREETFTLGNHSTSILVGNLSYGTRVGSYKATAATASLELSLAGLSGTANVGNVSLAARTGAVNISGLASVTLAATGGPARLASSSVLVLGAPITGTDFGPIICGGSREPFTNLPFSTWGLGAQAHLVGG
mgnify:CR=1 FL=1